MTIRQLMAEAIKDPMVSRAEALKIIPQAKAFIEAQDARIERLREALGEISRLGDARCDEAPLLARTAIYQDK